MKKLIISALVTVTTADEQIHECYNDKDCTKDKELNKCGHYYLKYKCVQPTTDDEQVPPSALTSGEDYACDY